MRTFFFGIPLTLALTLGAQVGHAATTQVEYVFSTPTYDTIIDHYLTPVRYTTDMAIEMAVTLDAPLAANLDAVPFAPAAWRYDDGQFSQSDTDLTRFNGYVSTDGAGNLTEFLVQVYLDAPHAPGVWVRRTAQGDAFSTAIGQEIVFGTGNPCVGSGTCDAIVLTQWAQDRATGAGPITVSMFAQDASTTQNFAISPLAASSVVPVPVPALLLGAGLALLMGLRRRRLTSA